MIWFVSNSVCVKHIKFNKREERQGDPGMEIREGKGHFHTVSWTRNLGIWLTKADLIPCELRGEGSSGTGAVDGKIPNVLRKIGPSSAQCCSPLPCQTPRRRDTSRSVGIWRMV